jgi:hypothetical protein
MNKTTLRSYIMILKPMSYGGVAPALILDERAESKKTDTIGILCSNAGFLVIIWCRKIA